MSEKKDSVYFQHLDVFRFVAAFMVVIMHSYVTWKQWHGNLGILTGGTYGEFTVIGKAVDQLIRNFQFGVDVFFLISGFLITYLLLKEKEKFGKIHIGKFYLRRILRIWPLYFLAIAVAPYCISWVQSDPLPNFNAALFFYNNFYTIQHDTWAYPFGHFWSICIEEHFYLIWPWIISLIPTKKLPQVFLSIILLSISFRIFTYYFTEFSWHFSYLHTLARADELVIGALLGYFYFRKPGKINIPLIYRLPLYGLIIFMMCTRTTTV